MLTFFFNFQAFLKHGSPAADKHPHRTASGESGEASSASMPSLASEESSPPVAAKDKKTVSVVAGKEVTSSEKTAVNALLMAATLGLSYYNIFQNESSFSPTTQGNISLGFYLPAFAMLSVKGRS